MDQISQIREKIDLIQLISEYIPLKQMGRNFKGLCPFHLEKSPSFVVSQERQIWHCFGCSKGGDAFTFLMEYEHLEFVEALRILAKRAGIELISSSFDSGVSSEKEKIYKMNRLALEFYHYLLTKHNVGKRALNYLIEKRKITDKTVETFLLGFSPNVGNVLSNYLLNKKGFSKKDLINSGLSTEKRGEIADFFSGRLMFPLFDHRDNVIGFSGRILEESSQLGPKYVNTKETLVYHKGNVFFGLNIAKNHIKKENQAIITEGELDVISSFQEGISNVVAVKGTALTEEQVNLISRFTQKVTLCFDQDNAGQEAIKRSIQVLEKKGMTITVIVIPNGKDPDESIKDNPLVFKKAVKEDIVVYDHLLSKALSRFDVNTVIGKKNISDSLLPFFIRIENEIVKEHYLKKLSKELDISYESILRQVEKLGKKETDTVEERLKEKKDRQELLEEYLLSLILQSEKPLENAKKVSNFFSDYQFKIPAFQKVFNSLILFSKNNQAFDSKLFSKTLPSELISAFDKCFLLPLPKNLEQLKYQEETEKVAKELYFLYLQGVIKKIGKEIKEKEGKIEEVEMDKLEQELQKYISLLPRSF